MLIAGAFVEYSRYAFQSSDHSRTAELIRADGLGGLATSL